MGVKEERSDLMWNHVKPKRAGRKDSKKKKKGLFKIKKKKKNNNFIDPTAAKKS